MSERIAFPADWTRASIKDIVDPSRAITYGIVQPGPRFDSDRGIPIIRGQDYSSGTVRTDGLYYVDPRLAASFSRASVQGGDLLVSIVGYVGTVAEVPGELAGANLTQTTARISVREQLKGRYFLHFLRSRCFRDEVGRFTKGSAQPGLNLADVEVMRVAYPQDAAERAAIAEVLDTLDITIRQTEAIIEKLKQVKQGLLHDLLTRGIAANGELRPPHSQAPHLYKDSPLGWIPREWRVEALQALALGGLMNGVFKQPKRVGSGVPLVNVADLYRGQHVDLSRCERFAATAAEMGRFGAQRGDIFFTRSSLKLEGIAQTSFLDDEPEGAVFECHVMRLRTNPALAAPRYLKEWCVARHARAHFMSHAKQVTMTTISQDGISSLRCPVPPLPEQVEAVRRISAVDLRISAEANDLRKQLLLKSGLMDDLLTGRVRVTPLLT